MKVKHIITTGGIILGGVAAMQSASAVVTYKSSADVQFTFNSSLSLNLEPEVAGGSTDFEITNLAPGNSKMSNQVNVVVSTSNAAGYTMSATVGNASNASTALKLDNANTFAMIGDSATSLGSGEWGYTLNGGTTYASLPLYTGTPKTLNRTVDATGTADAGYGGTSTTAMKIGAYAASDQLSGTYQNVVNFYATANVATHNLTVVAGDNVASVTPSTVTSNVEGGSVNISATCESGTTFNNWYNSTDYGTITDPSSASTTFIMGADDTTITAYCK